jgi:hypothetical protein
MNALQSGIEVVEQEPLPSGTALTHQQKKDAGYWPSAQREKPAAGHSNNNKIALVRRLASNQDELMQPANKDDTSKNGIFS